MRKIGLYVAIAGMMLFNTACNKDNAPEMGDLDEIEKVEPDDDKVDQPQEPVEYKPFEPIELTAKQGEKASIDNRFAFKMFKEVSKQKGENTFFSPLSLSFALGMLHNGASGETRTEMQEVLGMAGYTEQEINEYYQKMMKALLESDPLVELNIANSIWYRKGFVAKQPFIETNKTYFDAMVKGLDFSNPDAADTINNWCAEHTKDKIKAIIQKPINPDIVMYLINALYFKGQWVFQFNKNFTKQEVFTQSDKQELKVDLMEQTTYLPYYADQYVQCVEMPYGNQAFSMVAILPANNMNIEQLIEYLDGEAWQNIVDNMKDRKNVNLKMPRFKIECDIPLNEPVVNVGMKRIFMSGGLYNISDDLLRVSEIKQKTYVEVNEKGTEAAAVTVIAIVDSAGPPPPPPIPFFANRPFLYLIKEKSTGVILFIGRLDKPEYFNDNTKDPEYPPSVY